MNPKNTLLIIGGGYMASQIAKHFAKDWNIVTVDLPQIDICKPESIESVLLEHSPALVVNAAAYTNTHDAEKPEQHALVYTINTAGAAHIAWACRKHDIRMVHISTGMMFDGTPPQAAGWLESDMPSPTSYYTWTKAWADWQLLPRAATDGILITRIHTPVSRFASPKNLLTKLSQFSSAADDQTSLTVVEDYLIALESLVQQSATGLFHVVNSGTISFYAITELMRKHGMMPADKEVARGSLASINQDIAAKGGAYQPQSILANTKLSEHGISMPDVALAVTEAIVAYS